jgi:hypothetical protein
MGHITFVVTRFLEPWEKVWELVNDWFAAAVRQGWTWNVKIYDRSPEGHGWGGDIPKHVEVSRSINVGREIYPVLHFVHENYDSLPDVLVAVPAHWWNSFRFSLLRDVLTNMYDGFAPKYPTYIDWNSERLFTIDAWGGSPVNSSEVQAQPFTHARIRPYGAWYEARIRQGGQPVPFKNRLTLSGTIAIHKEAVLRYSKEQYSDWVKELEDDGPNPEIGHYWERSWYSMYS